MRPPGWNFTCPRVSPGRARLDIGDLKLGWGGWQTLRHSWEIVGGLLVHARHNDHRRRDCPLFQFEAELFVDRVVERNTVGSGDGQHASGSPLDFEIPETIEAGLVYYGGAEIAARELAQSARKCLHRYVMTRQFGDERAGIVLLLFDLETGSTCAVRHFHSGTTLSDCERPGLEGPGIVADHETKAVLQQRLKHLLQILRRCALWRFRDNVEAVGIEPGWAADYVIGVHQPCAFDEIEHGGAVNFVAIHAKDATAHGGIRDSGAGMNVGDFEMRKRGDGGLLRAAGGRAENSDGDGR